MQNFYLIRHGETDWNVKLKKLQGHTDIPLNEIGLEQGRLMAELVQSLGITKVISSDLSRAHRTAQFLSSQIEITSELREVNLGVGEGLTWDEVVLKLGAEFREAWSQNQASNLDMKFPTGESRREVLDRIQKCLLRFLEKHPGENIAFVSHGYVIRSLVYHLSTIKENFFVPNCAVVPFGFKNGKLFYTGPETTDLLLQPRVG
jgi:broad specificity phosphatase PhoE